MPPAGVCAAMAYDCAACPQKAVVHEGGAMSSHVTASHETVIVPATQLHIHVATWAGPRDALPLVMLHGIWDTWKTFERAALRLAAERTVHALDLRGHGESDKPEEGY